MATHGRDSPIAFDLFYPTPETAPRGKHDGSIIGTVRDRSNHGATKTDYPGSSREAACCSARGCYWAPKADTSTDHGRDHHPSPRARNLRTDTQGKVAGVASTEVGRGSRRGGTRSRRDGRSGHRTSLPSRPPASRRGLLSGRDVALAKQLSNRRLDECPLLREESGRRTSTSEAVSGDLSLVAPSRC